MPEDKAVTPNVVLESGTYEILRNRLLAQGKELRGRLDQLNAARKEVFGAIEFELLATEHVATKNNCVPRDMIPANKNRFIFGYNVSMGLRSETKVEDVFGIYEYREHAFHELPLDILNAEAFQMDFKELYRYYKETVFSRFHWGEPHFYMVFQIGKSASDIKAFKWRLDDKGVNYLGNRFDHETGFPPQQEFEWNRATRDLHRPGRHPHVSIEDRVFVDTLDGNLTIKVEDNTASGHGIYSEPVENKDQTLDDAEIYFATVGNLILLKIRPFEEQKYRYLVFNGKTNEVKRIDQIGDSCVRLPDEQGIIFQNGYCLQTGEFKLFETGLADMRFYTRHEAPNGEDFIYVFFNVSTGVYILLTYNRIERGTETPIICNGYSLFAGGELICFKCNEEARRHHSLQIWRTPFLSRNAPPSAKKDSFLFKIGNAPIVTCMAECNELLNLIAKQDTYGDLYVDLVKKATDITDAYFWLGDSNAFNLREALVEIKNAATAAIDEFEKVANIRRNTAGELGRVKQKTADLIGGIDYTNLKSIDAFVGCLTALRAVRGEIISLKELRYIDAPAVDGLEKEAAEHLDRLSKLCVEFLLKPEALQPYQQRVGKQRGAVEHLKKVTEAARLEEELAACSKELEMLVEIVGNLKIEDSTETTRIIENISAIYATLNQAKASLKTRKKELLGVEGEAQFGAQVKLLDQAAANYLDLCDTAKKCDECLTKLMVQIEEIEGRFADFEEHLQKLAAKREEIYNALSAKKLQLVEARNKRAGVFLATADRILNGVKNRAEAFNNLNEINSYFASDLMVEKVREIVAQLVELEDTVKADEIQNRLKSIRESAVQQLKDRLELFVDGKSIIQFGPHKFSVNTQPLDLTVVPRDGEMFYHLAGTNYFEKIQEPDFLATRAVWDQEVVSEDREVYRSEYLAYVLFQESLAGRSKPLTEIMKMTDEQRVELVRAFMASRYAEGYVKGVHDPDAAAILRALAGTHAAIGLLRYHPRARACARLAWNECPDAARREVIQAKLKSLGALSGLFPGGERQEAYLAELRELVGGFVQRSRLFSAEIVDDAAEYLFHEFVSRERFVISQEAATILKDFDDHLRIKLFQGPFENARDSVKGDRLAGFDVIMDWLGAFVSRNGGHDPEFVEEAAALLFYNAFDPSQVVEVSVKAKLADFMGNHAALKDRAYAFHYHAFIAKLRRFIRERAAAFERYSGIKKSLMDRKREALRLNDFKARVLTTFVRNQLIDQSYLPLIGANLAKQIGVAGADKRTDRMGLLLLISPPGYGKTTLVEYVANRLGLVFMKINGPALGHNVTSLDPAEAPNATAREEVAKLNLALEMGDNVMICLDDIQHCNPEFLQKFISLCDAQRRIEGVYQGAPRTYDLRGRKVAVVMAGNPYTESGEKFKIPDMLANRADTYNLGDIIGNQEAVFRMSCLENAITSNPYLQRLSVKNQKDVFAIVRYAETGSAEGIEFEGSYSPEEVGEMVAVMKSLLRIRDVVLRVNQEYIRSAAQADAYRTEPAFKLQGSYRNMNRLAEKVVPIMNEEEIRNLLDDHYKNEAQTLATGAEANLLKFKEMFGAQTEKEKERWTEITSTYKRKQLFAEADPGDPVGKVVVQLAAFREGLEAIKNSVTEGLARQTRTTVEQMQSATGPRQIETSISTDTLDVVRKFLDDWRQQPASTATPAVASALPHHPPAATEPASVSADIAPAPSEPPMQAPGESGPPGYQIEVRYSVPEVFTNIIQRQFQVMQAWMENSLATDRLTTTQLQQLRAEVDLMLRNYQELLNQLKGQASKPSRRRPSS
ncbi:MAG: DNA repair ATPase [Verrucomicrobia bacterium]|nr:DNA repair ATPase [Verrucomicrobiota bacterium]